MPSSSSQLRKRRGAAQGTAGKGHLLYGFHAVRAALLNPERTIQGLHYSGKLDEEIAYLASARGVSTTAKSGEAITQMLHEGSLHQGLCLKVAHLEEPIFEDLTSTWEEAEQACVIVLDQVGDARNLGAIMRSAYCLGADAVICTERHSASENAHLAKAASGALEGIPLVRVGNLSRSLVALQQIGFWCYGFTGDAEQPLDQVNWPKKTALVFGAEGRGLRRLSAESCDMLLYIPQLHAPEDFGVDSLNLAQSVSIALYAHNTAKD